MSSGNASRLFQVRQGARTERGGRSVQSGMIWVGEAVMTKAGADWKSTPGRGKRRKAAEMEETGERLQDSCCGR